jgi:hypothetical protein
MADELAPAFADARWIPTTDGKQFVEAPVQARGVPYSLIPGLHVALEDVRNGLDTFRSYLGREDSNTIDSLLCLPFSPFSQALPPMTEVTSDHTVRTCIRDVNHASASVGKAYLPDSTSELDAIAREPLFRRPSQTSIADNPFANSYEHVDSFFACACAIVLLARCLDPSADPLSKLWVEMDAWMVGNRAEGSLVAANAVLLLAAMYPCTWRVAEPCIHPTVAKAVPALASRLRAGGSPAPLSRLVAAEECEAGRAWWAPFRRDAWKQGVLPLLQALHEHDGSHYVPDETIAKVRTALEGAVQGAWLVHSPDGKTPPPQPCPAHPAASPELVRRPLIDPVFVGCVSKNIAARGALIGLKGHQLRQLANLAMGAHMPSIECQVYRNEGGLSLRVSSAADILDSSGKPRSAKSISPVQTEADESAYGNRDDKLAGCALQRKAWDLNTRMLAPIFTSLRAPLPRERRRRAENGLAWKEQNHVHAARREQQIDGQAVGRAKRYLLKAAASHVAVTTRAALAETAR